MSRPSHDAALHSSHPELTHIALGLRSTHDVFPPTFQDAARNSAEHEALRRRVRDAGGYVGAVWALGLEPEQGGSGGGKGIRPVEAEAYIAVPEHLIPPGVDQDEEQLPSAQHPSYPYGNPYAPTTGGGPATTLVATSQSRASAPKLDPRLHMHLAVAYHSSSLGGGGGGGAQQREATSSSSNAADRFEAILQRGPIKPPSSSSNSTTLAPHLVLRSRAETASNAPIWPFRRFGPGKGGTESLTRAESSRPWRPQREVWADFGLEDLQPRGGERDPLATFKEGIQGKRRVMEGLLGGEREREMQIRRERERARRREERKRAAAANVTGDESALQGEQSYVEDSHVGGATNEGESLLDESAIRAIALAESEEEVDAFEHAGESGYVEEFSMTGGQTGGDVSSVLAAARRGRGTDAEFSLESWNPDDDLEEGEVVEGDMSGRGGGSVGGGGNGFVWGRGRTAVGVRDRPATPYSEL